MKVVAMPHRAVLLKISLMIIAAAHVIASPTRASAEDARFSVVDTRQLLSLDGAWKSRGYGLLWYVRNRRVREYEISGRYCVFVEASDPVPDTAADTMRLDRAKQVIRIGVADGIGYLHTFDRLKELPPSCKTKPDRSPVGVFNAVDAIFSHHYAFFARRKLNWAKLVKSYRSRIKNDMSEEVLFRVLSNLLSKIGDEHVWLRGDVNGDYRRFSADGKRVASSNATVSAQKLPAYWSPEAAIRLLGKTAKRNESASIIYGLIDGDIGYLKVKSLWWRRVRDLNKTLRDALKLFQSASMVIVDVSSNGGGSEHLGKRVAERFAARRTIGLYKYAGDSKVDKPQAIFIEPSDGNRFLGPVYVISSRKTFSAAETLVMYMGVLPNVTHVGTPTAGALSDVLVRWLPNGWRVGLSNEIYLDTKGKSWEGIGIPPKLRLDIRTSDDYVSRKDLSAVRTVLSVFRKRAGPVAEIHD